MLEWIQYVGTEDQPLGQATWKNLEEMLFRKYKGCTGEGGRTSLKYSVGHYLFMPELTGERCCQWAAQYQYG